jgi:wyosine [tRNA(Phe)-imidazoG37] synthetase (radical SAM superfamily)
MSEPHDGELNVTEHSRDSAGLTYVYPVVSRRAGGVSIGINLNVNNACNWRCVYCQVPQLIRGAPPPVDLLRLEHELTGFLHDVLHGDFLATRVPAEARRLNDIALSGNGEPTSAKEFGEVVDLIGRIRRDLAVADTVKTVLITNGSLMHRPSVRAAVGRMAALNGEVWFKVDRATDSGMRRINSTRSSMGRVRANLEFATRACPTWIQTCVFAIDGEPPDTTEQQAYLDFLKGSLDAGLPLQGVLLYGLARKSCQPEAGRLSDVPAGWLESFANEIRTLRLPVRVSP